MKRLLAIAGFLALAACALVNGPSGYYIPTPNVGQWVAFGGKEPTPVNASWPIPCCDGSFIVGYYYTQLPVVPQVGMTLTLNYTVTGNNPVYVQAPASGGNSQTDTNPPTLHLFLWRKGDNLACDATTVNYRMFAARTPLVLGANQTISVKLDPTIWTNCYGATNPNLQDVLSNLLGVGVTFGGQSFAGHGVYLSSGNAQFTVNNIFVATQ